LPKADHSFRFQFGYGDWQHVDWNPNVGELTAEVVDPAVERLVARTENDQYVGIASR